MSNNGRVVALLLISMDVGICDDTRKLMGFGRYECQEKSDLMVLSSESPGS
jgi:hypothetical protein